MTRLGVFGGSFDPPHRTHARVARAALDQLQLDAVHWIPAAHPPHKPDRTLTADEHRMAMIRRVIGDEPRFRLDTRELELGGTSWTVDTLTSLTDEFPDAALFLILGSDNLEGFESWKEPDRIAGCASLVVYDRPASSRTGSAPKAHRPVIHLEGIRSDISSTALRKAIRATHGNDGSNPNNASALTLLRTHLHPDVLSYIRAHGLYL
jgi:nicotinate-nucleotide adenylyltransferase